MLCPRRLRALWSCPDFTQRLGQAGREAVLVGQADSLANRGMDIPISRHPQWGGDLAGRTRGVGQSASPGALARIHTQRPDRRLGHSSRNCPPDSPSASHMAPLFLSSFLIPPFPVQHQSCPRPWQLRCCAGQVPWCDCSQSVSVGRTPVLLAMPVQPGQLLSPPRVWVSL